MTAYFQSIWAYRQFWLSLVRMDLRTRYRRSVLGVGWSLMQPLTMTFIFSIVFQHFVQAPIKAYVPHVLTGLVLWNYVIACAVQGCQCFFQSECYIRQCPLPLAIYPLRTALGASFHLGMASIVLVGVATAFGGFPGIVPLLSLLPTAILLFACGWALAVIAGSANVFFQDTQHLTEVAFQILFYLTPIIYRAEDLQTHRLGWWLGWNPLLPFLALVRAPLIDHAWPSFATYGAALGVTAIMALVAGLLLRRLQHKLIFML